MSDRLDRARMLAEMAQQETDADKRTRMVRAVERELDVDLAEKFGVLFSPPPTEKEET